jgi:hypothetical protein
MDISAMVQRSLAAIAISAIIFGPTCMAQVHADETGSSAISIIFENDVFYDTDRHYTNGIRLSGEIALNDVPEWLQDAARQFPFFPDDGTMRAGFAVGQSIYTPPDITLENPPLDERPYAGWLYGSIGLVAESGRQLDQLELSLGVVGPASLADETQKFVHEITGSDDPRGWDTQLKNEPGVVLTYQHSWRGYGEPEPGLGFDATPHVGGALGNVFTYANAGVTLRFGEHRPNDYGPPRIQPSLPGSGFFDSPDGFGWYVFAGIEGRAVVRNIFLDGNSFTDSRSVDKEPFVGDLQFGVALTWQGVRLSYTHVLRTREFESQDESDNFGAFSASVRF